MKTDKLAILCCSLLFCCTQFVNAALMYEYEKTISLSGTPRGLCISSDGDLWVALSADNKVVRIDTAGNVLQTLSGFSTPYDVAVDASGNIYVADRGNKCVKRFDAAGTLQQTLNCGANVNGVTVAPNGEIYAAAYLQVIVFVDDTVNRTISTLSSDKFREVRKVCFTPDNALYYIDKNTGALKITDDSTNPAAVSLLIKKRNGSNVYNRLSYAAANTQGELFIVSAEDISGTSEQGVYRFTTTGTAVDTIGLTGVSAADNGFAAPWGIAVDEADNLYISDSDGKSIKVWQAVDENAPEVMANVWKMQAENTVRWTLKTNEQSSLYYQIRAASASVATAGQLLAQTPVNISANVLVHTCLTLESGQWQVDFLLKDKKGNCSAVVSSPILSTDLPTPTGLDTIRNRMLELLVGSDSVDYDNFVIGKRYNALLKAAATAFTNAQSYVVTSDLDTLNLAGSSVTDDIAVVRNMTQNALGPLALAYQIPGPDDAPNPYYQNKETLDTLLNMFRYLKARGVVSGCTLPFSGGGVYLRLTGFFYAAFLLQNELAEAGLLDYTTNLMAWATRWVNPTDEEWGAHVTNNIGRTDGVRTLYNNRLLYVLTLPANTTALADSMAYLVQALNNNYSLGSAWNGFLKPDYSAYHHLGVWGNAYIPDALHVGAQTAKLLCNTKFALNTKSVENLANGLLAMAQYSCKYDISRGICGRFPNNLTPLYGHVPAFAHIAEALPDGDLKTQARQWFNYLFDTDYSTLQTKLLANVVCDITFYAGLGIMEHCQKMAQMAFIQPDLAYNRTFPYAAMQVHRRENALMTVKGYSKYVWDFETNGGENWYGRNQAHGSMAVYSGVDDENVITAEASGVGYNGYDWNHVAGTTTFSMPLTDMLYEAKKFQWAKLSPEWFVGGVSHADNGLFAMKYADIRQAYDYENSRKWLGVKLRANKSYFFFDDMAVCLGSDINNTHDTYEAHTTLFQNILPETTTPISVNGTEQTALDYTLDQTETSACTLIDAVGNTYYLPNAAGLHVQRATQTSMNDKNTASTTGNYAVAWLNHGQTTAGSYEYAVWPKGVAQTENAYTVLRQDSIAHIVSHGTSNSIGYAVFGTSRALGDSYVVELSCPALLMLNTSGENLQLSLSNPELGFYDKNSFPYQVWSIPVSKQYLAAETQAVTLVLNGHYTFVSGDDKVVLESYSETANQTVLRFDVLNGETLHVTLHNENPSAVQTPLADVLNLYPNPADDYLRISSESVANGTIARLYNAYGALAWQQSVKNGKINISHLPAGVYLVEIAGKTARIMKK